MQIVAAGLNHTGASLDLRERAAFVPQNLPDALARLKRIAPEGFILSTCNRVEVYALAGHADSGADALLSFIAEDRGLARSELDAVAYAFNHEDAVRHLFRVASGLDSMVLGESEILGQLRRAASDAAAHGLIGPVMDKLCGAAIHAGRLARSRTAIARDSVSLVSLAVRAAEQEMVIADSNVLVVGTGDVAESVLRHLSHATPKAVQLAGRSHERAAEMSRRFGAHAVPWTQRAGAIANADVVVACTSAPAPVLETRDFARRGQQRLLCVDLGVPRDIARDVRELPGVSVIDVDELEGLAAAHRERRAGEAHRVEALVGTEVERFVEWWRTRQLAPTISQLYARAGAIRDSEVERALARLSSLDDTQQEVVRAMAQRIVNRLLHGPVSALKADATGEGDNLAAAIRHLFHLENMT